MATRKLILALCVACTAHQTSAHHSRAEFTGDVIELAGELIDISWSNPHPSFRLRLHDANATVWEIQAYGSVGTLTQTGVAREMFASGQQVTFAGLASGRRQLFLGTSALLPDGTEAILQYNGQPHWNGRKVGGSGSVVIDQETLDRAAAENRGFFRTWNVESTEIAVADLVETLRSIAYTEAARAAAANWDLTDNPITRCEPSWMPHTMIQPVDLELIDHGASLSLNNFYYSSDRTIYLENAPPAESQPLSRLGFSVGRWADANTLIIETDRITAPAFNGNGMLQSEQMRVVERFSLSEDQSRLDYRLEMVDPLAFDGLAVYETYYLALGREQAENPGGDNCD